MSKADFFEKYGSLESNKRGVASTNKDTWAYFTGMDRLLTRMKNEGDPDYAKTVESHMNFCLRDQPSASWILYSKHASQSHKDAAHEKYPSL